MSPDLKRRDFLKFSTAVLAADLNGQPASSDLQRDSLFTKGPSEALDHATSEMANGSKLGIDATKKLPGDGFKRPWPPLFKMEAAVKAKVEKLFSAIANSDANPKRRNEHERRHSRMFPAS